MQRPIDHDELSIFYKAVGEAVWQTQYLEHALVSFVVIKHHKRKPTSEEQAYARLEKERKGTLGSIYGRAKVEGIIPENLEDRFDGFISERNWLIHDSNALNSEDLYDEKKTVSIINRIQAVTDESIELTRIVLSLLEEFMKSEGFDLTEAYERADNYIRNLEGA